jgi:hypothetical protein
MESTSRLHIKACDILPSMHWLLLNASSGMKRAFTPSQIASLP